MAIRATLALALAVAAGFTTDLRAAETARKPNLVFILADDSATAT